MKNSPSPLTWQFEELWHGNISNHRHYAVIPAAYVYLYLRRWKVLCTALNSSYAEECGCTGFLLSCWGLCGDVLSVLHLSHSWLSCLSTTSPVWPRFKGADVNHWFAISKLNIPVCVWGSRPVWIWIGYGSTSSCRLFHLMVHNFQCENDPCVCFCAPSVTFDLSLTVRMCCRPEESSAFSLSVRNSVSKKSNLKMEARVGINQHPFTEKGNT